MSRRIESNRHILRSRPKERYADRMVGVLDRSTAVFSRGPGAERIAYFSDAVYAIALTLLVVDLKIPEGSTSAAAVIVAEWPSYLGFALSFVIISVSWAGHHRRFRAIVRHDPGLIVVNLALLFGIASVPLPTALLAEFAPQPTAVAVYAAVIAYILLAQLATWVYAYRRGLVSDVVDRGMYWNVVFNLLPTPIVFLLSIPIAYVFGGQVGMYSWLSLAVIGPVAGRLVAREIDRRFPSPPQNPETSRESERSDDASIA